jgi:hypothetical protein
LPTKKARYNILAIVQTLVAALTGGFSMGKFLCRFVPWMSLAFMALAVTGCDSSDSTSSAGPAYTVEYLSFGMFRSGMLLHSSLTSQFEKGTEIAFKMQRYGSFGDSILARYGYLTVLEVSPTECRIDYFLYGTEGKTIARRGSHILLHLDRDGLDIDGDGNADVNWISSPPDGERSSFPDARFLSFARGGEPNDGGESVYMSYRILNLDVNENDFTGSAGGDSGIVTVTHSGVMVADDMGFNQTVPYSAASEEVTYSKDWAASAGMLPDDIVFVTQRWTDEGGRVIITRLFRIITAVTEKRDGSLTLLTRGFTDEEEQSIWKILSHIKVDKTFHPLNGPIKKKSVSVAGNSLGVWSDHMDIELKIKIDIEFDVWKLDFSHFYIFLEYELDGDLAFDIKLEGSDLKHLIISVPLFSPIPIPDTPFVWNPVGLSANISGGAKKADITLKEAIENVKAWAEFDWLDHQKLKGDGSGNLSIEDLEGSGIDVDVTPRAGFNSSLTLAEILGFPITFWAEANIRQEDNSTFEVTPKIELTGGINAEIDDLIKYNLATGRLWGKEFASKKFKLNP